MNRWCILGVMFDKKRRSIREIKRKVLKIGLNHRFKKKQQVNIER